MTSHRDEMCAELEALTLRELRELYSAVFGEQPRSPNKRFLARRIVEQRAHSAALTIAERNLTADLDPPSGRQEPGPEQRPGCEHAEGLSLADSGETEVGRIGETMGIDDAPENGQTERLLAALEQAQDGEDGPAALCHDEPEGEIAPSITVLEEPAPGQQSPAAHDESEAHAAASEPIAEARSGAEASTETAPTTLVGTLVHRRGQFKGMTVRQLQAMYLQVVGRKTGSSDAEYIKWKIREVQNGNLKAGPRLRPARPAAPKRPRASRARTTPTVRRERVMILPLRLHASAVAQLDACWKSRNDKSRMSFLKRALAFYLGHLGAHDVAALIDPEPGEQP